MASNHPNQNHDQDGLKQDQVVVVMVPFLAQGHLNPLLQLSRLITSYDIPVHFFSSAIHNRQARLRVQGWNPIGIKKFHFHDFTIPPFASPPPNPNSTTKFPTHLLPSFNASSSLREPLTALMRHLSSKARRVIIIYDALMSYVVQDVSSIENAEAYTFHSVSAFATYLYIWEMLGKPIDLKAELIDPKDIPSLEGCIPVEFLNFLNSQYQFTKLNSGNLHNSCKLIEAPFIDLLAKQTIGASDKHWAIGPFNPVAISENKLGSKYWHKCLEWLDKQAPNSVIYVSFGTSTALNDEEIKELAIGLEESEQNFIWVLRDADKGDVSEGGEVRRVELPKGFEERVKEKGIVVRDWAPQLEILGHPSTGGFMSHCGWNSCIESITMGVPLWPMHSDQPRNTVLVTKVLKLGLVVKD